MAFQERNETCGMKQERSEWNLAENSGTNRDLKWDEICSVLFRFLNWYGTFQPFWTKQNEIDNLAIFYFKKWGNQLIESRNLDSIFNLDSTYRIEKSCIYRLSLRIGELDEKAYTPSIMHMYGLLNRIYLFLYFKNIFKKI